MILIQLLRRRRGLQLVKIKFNNTGSNNKQDALIKKSERSLALSKLEGKPEQGWLLNMRLRMPGLRKDDPRTKRMEDEAAATYRNIEAQKKLKSETKSSATAAESVAQKVENLRKQSEQLQTQQVNGAASKRSSMPNYHWGRELHRPRSPRLAHTLPKSGTQPTLSGRRRPQRSCCQKPKRMPATLRT